MLLSLLLPHRMPSHVLFHMQVTFRNPIRYGLKKELFIAPEGLYSGQARPMACASSMMLEPPVVTAGV